MLGEKIAQVALAFGVDDLDGTVVDEKSGMTPVLPRPGT